MATSWLVLVMFHKATSIDRATNVNNAYYMVDHNTPI